MRLFSPRLICCLALLMLGTQGYSQSQKYYVYGIEHAQHFTGSENQNYYIVLGSFNYEQNAHQLYKSLKSSFISVKIRPSNGMYRVTLGPIYSAQEVREIGAQLAGMPRAPARRVKPAPVRQPYPIKYYPTPEPIRPTQPTMQQNPVARPSYPTRPTTQARQRTPVASSAASSARLWSFTGSLGFTDYAHMYQSDGQTILGRFDIGRTLFARDQSTFGLEVGVQNGNDMRLSVPQSTLDELGGLPIQSTVKPMVDLLLVMQNNLVFMSPFFTQLKAGIAYRSWEFADRNSVNDPFHVAAEIQAGLGYHINDRASLNLLYQGIFGGNPSFTANAAAGTGHVENIPIQNGLLLGLSLHV